MILQEREREKGKGKLFPKCFKQKKKKKAFFQNLWPQISLQRKKVIKIYQAKKKEKEKIWKFFL